MFMMYMLIDLADFLHASVSVCAALYAYSTSVNFTLKLIRSRTACRNVCMSMSLISDVRSWQRQKEER